MTLITENELHIETIELKKAALIFRAINHPLRQQMMHIMHNNGSLTVTEIYVKLRLEQSVASQHLAILRRAGFVKTSREGKRIFYSVNHDRLQQVHEVAHSLQISR
jgi:DNA-binding transcriptional ArsR family regulator